KVLCYQMAVDAQCGANVRVPHDALNPVWVQASAQHARCVRMPEVMRPHLPGNGFGPKPHVALKATARCRAGVFLSHILPRSLAASADMEPALHESGHEANYGLTFGPLQHSLGLTLGPSFGW